MADVCCSHELGARQSRERVGSFLFPDTFATRIPFPLRSYYLRKPASRTHSQDLNGWACSLALPRPSKLPSNMDGRWHRDKLVCLALNLPVPCSLLHVFPKPGVTWGHLQHAETVKLCTLAEGAYAYLGCRIAFMSACCLVTSHYGL